MLSQLKDRLEFLSDEKLQDLYKKVKEPTEADIKSDIERLSKNIRNTNSIY